MARLLHLSDLHAVASGTRVSGVLDTPALLKAAIDTLLERFEALSPLDAVLVTGDISDDGSPESYAVARAELERLGLPLLVIPGNHDRRDALRAGFIGAMGMPSQGLIDWVVDLKDARIIGIDTLVEGQGGGRVRPESLAVLSAALTGAGGRPVIVALHHPPLNIGIKFMDAIGLENRDALKAAVSSHSGSLRLLAGHVHGVYHGALGPYPVSTAPSTCSAFRFDRRMSAPVGFMTEPLGCALVDTALDGIWTEIALNHGDGPFRF